MILLPSNQERSLQIKLYQAIRQQISQGIFPPEARLPSVRQMAELSSVSRNTVEAAYEQLCMEGYIYSKPRSGYFVACLEAEVFRAEERKVAIPKLERAEAERRYRFDFHPAALASESFPLAVWRKLSNACLQQPTACYNVYANPQGENALRAEILHYLRQFRGVVCELEQLVVCSGLQESLQILAQILREDHTTVASENPGHWLPRVVFQQYSYAMQPVAVQADGLDVDALRATGSRLVYVTPSHQFPLGCVMPIENRLKLLQWAQAVDGIIIEDDYDSELRYQGKPVPALQGLQPEGNIVYLGTFSKVLSPALRVSYMVLPQQLLGRYRPYRERFANSVSLLEQHILTQFMAQGYWERHLRKMRTLYRRKQAVLLAAIEDYFPFATVVGRGAGLHVIVRFPENSLSEAERLRRAADEGIRLVPLQELYQPEIKRAPQIILGFGRMEAAELTAGVQCLADLWQS